MRPLISGALIILAAAGCASASGGWASSIAAVGAMPAEVDDFRLTATQRYPDRSTGTLYRYRNDSELKPDVYVYPIPDDERTGLPASDIARDHTARFAAVLELQRRQRVYEAYNIVSDRRLREVVGADSIHGWHIHAVVNRRGRKLDTHQHVYVVRDHFVKIRTTFPMGKIEPAQIDRFTASLLRNIGPPAAGVSN